MLPELVHLAAARHTCSALGHQLGTVIVSLYSPAMAFRPRSRSGHILAGHEGPGQSDEATTAANPTLTSLLA